MLCIILFWFWKMASNSKKEINFNDVLQTYKRPKFKMMEFQQNESS